MIRWSCDPEGMQLELRGHAGMAPYGQDLVCAGASMLVYALAYRVKQLEAEGALLRKPVVDLKPGNALIKALPTPEAALELKGAFRMAQSGLRLLEEQYPGCMKRGLFQES